MSLTWASRKPTRLFSVMFSVVRSATLCWWDSTSSVLVVKSDSNFSVLSDSFLSFFLNSSSWSFSLLIWNMSSSRLSSLDAANSPASVCILLAWATVSAFMLTRSMLRAELLSFSSLYCDLKLFLSSVMVCNCSWRRAASLCLSSRACSLSLRRDVRFSTLCVWAAAACLSSSVTPLKLSSSVCSWFILSELSTPDVLVLSSDSLSLWPSLLPVFLASLLWPSLASFLLSPSGASVDAASVITAPGLTLDCSSWHLFITCWYLVAISSRLDSNLVIDA